MASVIREQMFMKRLTLLANIIYVIAAGFLTIFFTSVGFWTFDRHVPFEMYRYTTVPAKPGGTLYIQAEVRRDLHRNCSVSFSRVMYDVKGVRFWESPETYINPKGLADMDLQMKGDLFLALPVPLNAPVGPMTISTYLKYKCNPIHSFWPIETTININTNVLPPEF